MLIKLPLSGLKQHQDQMNSIADKMEGLNAARIAKLIEINADKDHTLGWKSTQTFPLTQSPELHALAVQMKLQAAVIDEQRKLWRDSVALLREAAVPDRKNLGVNDYSLSINDLNFLMSESAALGGTPATLQNAVDAAVMAEDWKRLYCLTVGRIDGYGRALPSATGLDGTPLDCLPLPGRDESEEIFHVCDIAKIRCEAVMINLSSGDMNPTADSSSTKLARESWLIVAQRKHADAIQQRDRLRAAPSALERWEMYLKLERDPFGSPITSKA